MNQNNSISLIIAETATDFEEAKRLFTSYAGSLGIDLSFQDFDKELNTISVQYNKPGGALILAHANGSAVACAGVRKLDDDIAELKRMYVMPAFRGQKIAQQMLAMAITIATELHYKCIRLDTLQDMKSAQKLYYAYGFYDIPAYRYNPVEGAVYMEKKLGV